MCQVLNMSGFWIFEDFQYARALNFQGYTRLTYLGNYDRVLNRRPDAIMEEFWIIQHSKYARFLHVQALQKVLKMSEYCWIMPEQTILTVAGFWICWVNVSQGFEYFSVSKCARTRNMVRLWICEGYTSH